MGPSRAIVTGGARGIGAAIVHRLVRDGASVAVLDRDGPGAQAMADQVGGVAVTVDLADVDAVGPACRSAASALGGCDVLVNNAGIFVKASLTETTAELWDTIIAVNARSMLLTMQALAAELAASGRGAIVNVASMAAKLGTRGESAYVASKAAVVALSRIAAFELGVDAITVNSVCPGYVLTEMGTATRTEQDVAHWSAGSPLGRCTQPSEVADLVAFLASDGARGITGQAINVTAGMVTW